MTVDATFIVIGNHPATDLVNTEVVSFGRPGEALDSADALVTWTRLVGISDADPRTSSPAAADRALEHAPRQLRRAARRALESAGYGSAAFDEINEAFDAVRGSVHVDPDGARSMRTADPADQLSMDLIVAVADIFDHDLTRVRRCAGERCVLMFLDTSKTGRRRWCDMAVCGNRSKSKTHYARTKQPPPAR